MSSRSSLFRAAAALVAVAVLAITAAGGLGLYSLRRVSVTMNQALSEQIGFLNDESSMIFLLYQKGFVTEALLSGDASRLQRLEDSRRALTHWFARARSTVHDAEAQKLLLRIEEEYRAYDQACRRALALSAEGRDARALLHQNETHMDRLVELSDEFSQLAQRHAEATLRRARQALERRASLLFAISLAGSLASMAIGFLLAQRVGRPIYELQLQVESAVQRTRLTVPPGRGGLLNLSEHVGALLRKLDETDQAIVEQRRRLVQSEKLSAIGEVSAQLAHEILNPLSGIKAAVHALSRGAPPTEEQLEETTAALDHEIDRVGQLLQRVIRYARPLQADTAPCLLGELLDDAVEAAQPAIQRAGVTVVREAAGEVLGMTILIDRLLMTQALVNLLQNAAQASPPKGRVTLRALRRGGGQEQLVLQVEDEGPGVAEAARARLFQPFFTTKAQGHGLGLATTQNIVMEHGGVLSLVDRGVDRAMERGVDREARSAAVVDREARSAAVVDREARSAAVVDREARSAAVVDREARSAAVVDRGAARGALFEISLPLSAGGRS